MLNLIHNRKCKLARVRYFSPNKLTTIQNLKYVHKTLGKRDLDIAGRN